MPGASGVGQHSKGYGQYTSAASVTQLGVNAPNAGGLSGVVAIPEGSIKALIQAETQDIRWTDDPNTTPTASVGNLLKVNTILEYEGDLSRFKFIQVAATAVVNVNYYGI